MSKQKSEPKKIIKLVHRFTQRGAHRLEKHSETDKPVVGEWAGSSGVAILGEFRGVSEYYTGTFPIVFKVTPVEAHEVTE